MDLFFDSLAVILLFVGVALNVFGIWGTWKEWAPEGQDFWATAKDFAQVLRRHALRVFGREEPVKHASGSASAGLGLYGTAKGYKGLGPLPSTDDMEAFATAVKSQIDEVLSDAQRYRDQAQERDEQRQQEIKRLAGELKALKLTADARLRQAMTDGLRLEVGGVLLVVLSGVCQVLKLVF